MQASYRGLTWFFSRTKAAICFISATGFFGGIGFASTQINVLTYHNDNARTGLNTNETLLTPANVNTNSFKLLFTYPVDGDVYAQPLYVQQLSIPGEGTHNVIFVATENNSVYAFDADSNGGAAAGLLWQTNLGTAASTPNGDFGNRYGPFLAISPHVGITGTPVIDPVSGTLYVNAFTLEGGQYFHRIHALNITNGMERTNSPVLVKASIAGTGVDSSNGVVTFNAEQELERTALTLAGGVLYVCYCSFADTDPFHGWIMGFNPNSLQLLTNYVFNTTPNSTVGEFGPNAGEGGIWMGGSGLAVDADTNVFVAIGNGPFNANITGGTEYGDSIIRFSTTNQLAVADYFTPYNQSSLAEQDNDLGSGGLVLLPDSVGSVGHPHLLVGCSKDGTIYLVDRDGLGGFNAAGDSQIVAELPNVLGIHGADGDNFWGSPAYFNNEVYFQGAFDVMKAFAFTNGSLGSAPVSMSPTTFVFPGATPSISANGTSNGIVWILECDAVDGNGSDVPAILHAYNPNDLTQEYYNSSQAGSRDTLGVGIKFTVPTIVNGKVYAGVQNAVSVFGTFANNLTLQIVRSGSNLVTLSWAPVVSGRIQTTPAIQGTNTAWTDLGTANPMTVPVGESSAFFRVISP